MAYNYDKWHEAVPSQAGYTPLRSVNGYELGIGGFSSPSDIAYDESDGLFYIADTGNSRIIAVNSDFTEAVRIYDSLGLNAPSGVFSSGELLYIADTDNSRVLVLTKSGEILHEIEKPESVYDQSKTFLPQKVIADKAGNIYVLLNNITNGCAVFSSDGSFQGFYGADHVNGSSGALGDYLSFLLISDAKRARRLRSIPSGISGFDIDGDFIFTCTSSRTDAVKKLNPAGQNILPDNLTFGDYTPMYDTSANRLYASEIIDIDISEGGLINCLDRTAGRVFQYDEDCNLLFIFGGIGKQVGTFQQVAAVESAGDKVYILDSLKNSVTVFGETDFGNLVHEAAELYTDGFYDEALAPFQEILRRDGSYTYACRGIASAAYRQGDYIRAMEYAELADEQILYDKAFEGFRREFIGDNFALLIVLAALVIFLIRRLKHGLAHSRLR